MKTSELIKEGRELLKGNAAGDVFEYEFADYCLEHLPTLLDTIERHEAALEFYGQEALYDMATHIKAIGGDNQQVIGNPIMYDRGTRAREALNPNPKKEE